MPSIVLLASTGFSYIVIDAKPHYHTSRCGVARRLLMPPTVQSPLTSATDLVPSSFFRISFYAVAGTDTVDYFVSGKS